MKTEYNATPTLSKFHRCNDFYRITLGPVGSGKSTASCAEIIRRAQQQSADKRKIRKSRFAVIRGTYRELEDTTIKTWQDWFPPQHFGDIRTTGMSQKIYKPLPDGTTMDCEILFRALEKPQDIKKLLSLELTGAWINEIREVPKGIVDAIGDRVGRYPSIKDGGCTWRGVFGDTNMPDDDHWIYRLAEKERPEGWGFFKQPGGLIEQGGAFIPNPKAENIAHLEPGYYMTRVAGKSKDYIRVYYCAQYGFVRDGKPVFPEYVDAVHCSHKMLQPHLEHGPIWTGVDFGLTPAAVMGQQVSLGRWIWFDELVTEDMGAVRFSELLRSKILQDYPSFLKANGGPGFRFIGDPAGAARADTDEKTPFQILEAAGIPAVPAPTNDAMIRREAVASCLSRLIDGKPGLMLSPKCAITRKGLAGGYCYKRIQVAGDERYQDKPNKNRFSHPCEAGEYLLLGAGEGYRITENPYADADDEYVENHNYQHSVNNMTGY